MAPPPTACPWCSHPLPEGAVACPTCGAPANASTKADAAGWLELPSVRDMAQLHFGHSSCQISGQYVPVADFALAPGELVYFTHHVLLWRDPTVQVSARSLKGAWKRMFAGMPLVMAEAKGPGHIAFSRDAPGELLAVPLDAGQELDVREHVFVAATSDIAYDWFQTGIWYRTRNGDETETHYPLGMFMDRFSAAGRPGLLLLHGVGNLFVRTLAPGQSLLIKPNALLYKDPSVSMQLVIERVTRSSFGGLFTSVAPGGRYLWVRVQGPGRVAIQSADKHHHETLGPVVNSSGEIRDW